MVILKMKIYQYNQLAVRSVECLDGTVDSIFCSEHTWSLIRIFNLIFDLSIIRFVTFHGIVYIIFSAIFIICILYIA